MIPLLLLHGALGAADQFTLLQEKLEDFYKLYIPEFPGHGRDPMPEEPFSIPFFAQYVLDYMDQMQLERISIFGYSMGGYVALYLARHHPERVKHVMTLGTKLHWDQAVAQKEKAMLQPETILVKVPALAEALEKRHFRNNWKEVVQRTATMLEGMGDENPLGPEDWPKITARVLLTVGDRDTMVSLEETRETYLALSNAALCVLPWTAHPMERVSLYDLNYYMREFL